MDCEVTVTPKRTIRREDILPADDYARRRRDYRRRLLELKRQRRIEVGPYVTFYFENFATVLAQVQEMLHIEKGGEAQLAGEIAAYAPLVPNGRELVATMMIEIPEEERRRRILAALGGIEKTVSISLGGQPVPGVPEDDIERTTAEGKTSAVHFLHFPFTPDHIAEFRRPGAPVVIGVAHPAYGHLAVLPNTMRATLAEDFD